MKSNDGSGNIDGKIKKNGRRKTCSILPVGPHKTAMIIVHFDDKSGNIDGKIKSKEKKIKRKTCMIQNCRDNSGLFIHILQLISTEISVTEILIKKEKKKKKTCSIIPVGPKTA